MMTSPIALKVLQEIRINIQMGKSVSQSVLCCTIDQNDPFRKALRIWRARSESGQEQSSILAVLPDLSKTIARRALVTILERGLKGAPVNEYLSELETEMFRSAEQNYEKHLQLLPLKMMIPLVLLIMPAVMLLLVGPLLFSLMQKF